MVSPQTVVSSRLVTNYTNVQRLGAEYFNWGDLGVKNYLSYQPKYAQLNVSNPGFTLGGGTANTSAFRTFSSGFNMDARMSRATHQWAIGSDKHLRRSRLREKDNLASPFVHRRLNMSATPT